MMVLSSQSQMGSGIGTFFDSGVDGLVLYLCNALSILNSRSIWCAVFEMRPPSGFFRSTYLALLIANSTVNVVDPVWAHGTYVASVKKYVGFDYSAVSVYIMVSTKESHLSELHRRKYQFWPFS